MTVTTNYPITALYTGKANVQDITNPLVPLPVDGNATFHLKITDMGDPGSSDKIAITVWNKSGGLWFASSWDGTKPVEQLLNGGNLKVHGGILCAPTSTMTTRRLDEEAPGHAATFLVKAYPNPTNH